MPGSLKTAEGAGQRIDLHCHTLYSHDNYLKPRDLIRRAREVGLDGVVVTEHHSFEVGRAVDLVARDEGFPVFRGVEVSTNRGHILLYGVCDDSWNIWGRNNYLDAAEVIAVASSLGAAAVAAHPYRLNDLYPLGEAIYELEGLAAVETANGRNQPEEDRTAEDAARTLGLPRVGGSDCHLAGEVGRCYTVFERPVESMTDLVRELLAGRCRPGRLQRPT
jgi:predicted metal-dependent phosphoesterase TrpH